MTRAWSLERSSVPAVLHAPHSASIVEGSETFAPTWDEARICGASHSTYSLQPTAKCSSLQTRAAGALTPSAFLLLARSPYRPPLSPESPWNLDGATCFVI